ncbi:unnamed protein product [Linum trigynum]|uniref:Uncharacterized protein n=1 Tax=Linum trigynum TaxID=586398 RepID=A0AAV2D146_9ROSI
MEREGKLESSSSSGVWGGTGEAAEWWSSEKEEATHGGGREKGGRMKKIRFEEGLEIKGGRNGEGRHWRCRTWPALSGSDLGSFAFWFRVERESEERWKEGKKPG